MSFREVKLIIDVSTQEVLIRTHDIPIERPNGSKPLRDISSIVKSLKTHEVKKAERRVTQMRNAREKLLRAKAGDVQEAEGLEGAEGVKRRAEEDPEHQAKRPRTDDYSAQDAGWTAPETPESTIHSQILLRIQPEMRGHTSYLTFATLPPLHIRNVLSDKADDIVRAEKSDKETDVSDDKTVTEYADADLDDKLGTLTEEEMLAMLARD